MNVIKKIPGLEQLAPVYALIAMIVYSWAALRFFYRFPSWLFYSTVGEISTFLAYLIAVNLLESLSVLFALVLLGVLLPHRWFNERFVTRSVSIALLGLGYLIYVNRTYPTEASYPLASYSWVLVVTVVILILTFLIDRIGFFRTVLESVANRMVVFLYIIVPISTISLLVVVIRNIL